MPVLFTKHTDANTAIVLWKITEPEIFFSATVEAGKKIAHPHKRLQHLCGRYLLRHLVPQFPLRNVVADLDNKPFLPGHPFHFSISHSGDYAAAIVSTAQQVGIDVEKKDDKAMRLRKKFLTHAEEMALLNDWYEEAATLTLAWSVKESLFKWLGEAGVDFKEQLVIEKMQPQAEHSGLIIASVHRNKTYKAEVCYQCFDDVILTWLQTPPTSE